MKKILLISILGLYSAIGYSQKKTTSDLTDFRWLIGSWKQIDTKPGQSDIETCRRPDKGKYIRQWKNSELYF